MPLYKIADVVVSMNQRYKETEDWYRPYLYEGNEEPGLKVQADDKDIEYFVSEGVDITPPIAENMCLCEGFNYRLPKYDGSYIHSSAVLYKDKVYLFSASSGVGKSTLTRRIVRLLPGSVIINDDKPSFRLIDGKCIVYGTPFAGGTSLQQNLKGELGAVIFLERSEENTLSRISAAQSTKLLFQQVKIGKNPKRAERLLSMFSAIIEKYPFYLLSCTNSDDAAYKAFEAIKHE